jgi:hypothetical protein
MTCSSMDRIFQSFLQFADYSLKFWYALNYHHNSFAEALALSINCQLSSMLILTVMSCNEICIQRLQHCN